MLVAGSIYTVSEGNRALVLRFGQLHAIETPGLHFRIPLVDKVFPMPLKEQHQMTSVRTFSSDGVPIEMTWSMLYALNEEDLFLVFQTYRDAIGRRLLATSISGFVNRVVPQYTQQALIDNNVAMIDTIGAMMQNVVAGKGITLKEVHLIRWAPSTVQVDTIKIDTIQTDTIK